MSWCVKLSDVGATVSEAPETVRLTFTTTAGAVDVVNVMVPVYGVDEGASPLGFALTTRLDVGDPPP